MYIHRIYHIHVYITYTSHISYNICVSYVIIYICRGPKIRRESKRGGIIPRKCQ